MTDTPQPKTTPVEDGEHKAASRRHNINLIWEITQAVVAFSLVLAAILSAFFQDSIPDTLNNALFIVMGFYFGRTNHARPTR